jgi:hypothetical protein
MTEVEQHLSATVSKCGFRLIGSETVPMTKDLAKKFKEMPGSPTERELNPRRVHHLHKKMEQGLAVPFMWADVVLNGITYRANGQHSSDMLHQFNGDFPTGCIAHIDHYEAEDINGLVTVFRQFDDRKSARTPIDVSGAFQNVHSELHEVPRSLGKLAIEGVNWHRGSVEGVDKLTGDDQYILFNNAEYYPFVVWFAQLMNGAKAPELKLTPVVAATLSTFTADEEAATEFWTDVRDGGREYEEQHPASVLYDWLHRFRDGEFSVKQPNLYQGSVYGWNAYRDGKATIPQIKSDIRRGMTRVL